MKNFFFVMTTMILCVNSPILKADQLNVLGAADAFSVMGATTVTNTNASTLAGDLGLIPGSSITGTASITIGGSTHINDSLAGTASLDATSAYSTLQGLTPTLSGFGTIGTSTLTPGVYNFSSAALLNGPLTLDFGGLSGQSFVFQVGSALTTASGSSVSIINEGTNDSVYWAVDSSATLGTTSTFEGTIIAQTSITLDHGATIGCGSALALTGAVTMDNNTIGGGCAAGDSTGMPSVVGSSTAPEPSSLVLFGTGLIGLASMVWRRSRRVVFHSGI